MSTTPFCSLHCAAELDPSQSMDGYTKYEMLVAEWASEYMRPFLSQKAQREMPEQSRVFLTKLFRDFMEISNTVEALRLAEVLISLAPPRSKRIKRDEYLKYHINSYLQEIYILKKRLNGYVTKLKRVYAKTKQGENFDRCTTPLFKVVKDFFEGIVNIRGYHVHSYRYSDNNLDHLSSLTFLSRFKDDFVDGANVEFKSVKRIWSLRMKENNKATRKLLNIYFDRMYEAVTKDGKIAACTIDSPSLEQTKYRSITD